MLTSQVEIIAKKLSVFEIDDVSMILDEPDWNIQEALIALVDKNKLKFNNGQYFYIEPIKEKPKRERHRPYKRKEINYKEYDKGLVDSFINFFCAEVETTKAALLLGLGRKLADRFYADFRKLIYERQLNELQIAFEQKPKLPTKRTYLDTTLCLYEYDGNPFVSKETLIGKNLITPIKQERLNLKIINSMLIRRFEKCCHKFFVEHRAAECIWRRNKEFKLLVKELKQLVNEKEENNK